MARRGASIGATAWPAGLVGIALVGWFFTGLTIIALGILAPQLIKRSAPHFLLQQALHDPAVYEELAGANILRVSRMAPGDS